MSEEVNHINMSDEKFNKIFKETIKMPNTNGCNQVLFDEFLSVLFPETEKKS